jgi:hypothetical protein
VNSKLQTRLGTLSSWSFFTLSWMMGIRLVIALVSDPNRTENYSPLWFVLWLISTAAMAATVLLIMALGLRRRLKRKPSVLGNLLTIGFAGLVANVTVGWLANVWGLDKEGIWHVRAFGGFVGMAIMFAFFNNVRGSMIERNEKIRELTEVEDKLLGYQESAKQILADANEQMRTSTIETISPSIEKINQLLSSRSDSESRLELIEELRDVIQNKVRPLSKSIGKEAEALSIVLARKSREPKAKPTWQSKFNLRQSLAIRPVLLVLISAFPMIAFLVIDHRSMVRGLLSALGVGLTMFIIKQFLPKRKEINTWLGMSLQALFAIIAVVPGLLINLGEYGPIAEVFNFTWWMVGLSIGSFVGSAYARAVDAARDRYAAELELSNQQLAKEVALFEQKLWLERRAWSYVLHGDVQGALSAAATRLQRSEKLEPYELEMVKQDIARAKSALTKPPSKAVNFSQGIDELVRAWAGVCDIKIESSARASRAIESNRDVRNCINEICKEAVSNAVRHGNAKNAWIYLNREKDDVVEIEVCNDGHRLLRNQTQGMGLAMIEDLSLNWQLTSDRHKGKTCLVAELPIGNKN